MVADDLLLMVNTSNDEQELVSEAQLNASMERFNFSKTKTRSMLITKRTKSPTALRAICCTIWNDHRDLQ